MSQRTTPSRGTRGGASNGAGASGNGAGHADADGQPAVGGGICAGNWGDWSCFFVSGEFGRRLQDVLEQLRARGHADAYEADALECLRQLARANELALGERVAPSSRPFPKLPAHVFADCSTDGAVQNMLDVCYTWKRRQKWSEFQFAPASRRDAWAGSAATFFRPSSTSCGR